MKFHEKLDFLMNVTKTTNSRLAMHISIDASHISRLRRGERSLVPDAEYLVAMSIYFIKQCGEEFLKMTVADAAKIPVSLFDHPVQAAEKIYQWLRSEYDSDLAAMDSILSNIHYLKNDKQRKDYTNGLNIDKVEMKNTIHVLYGTQGKREAVSMFLAMIAKNKTPGDILLYSDEPMDWLTEDEDFQKYWFEQLLRVISQGNRIKIIHTVSRNLDEMLEVISKWIPLYLSGAIKSYYYPRKRDGIFRRTIFVAPGKVGVSTNSIGLMTDKVTNLFLQEKMAVASLTEEFNSYLDFCKPLIQTFTNENRSEYFKALNEFEKVIETTILNSGELSLITMPEHVARSIIDRSSYHHKNNLMDIYHLRKERFLNLIETKSFIEIIRIDDLPNIRNGLSKIGYSGIHHLSESTYTFTEYKHHLENMVRLLKRYPNYHLVIEKGVLTEGYRLYAKEDFGIIVKQNTKPYVVLSTNEKNTTAAFWDFLNLHLNVNQLDKKAVIKRLEDTIIDLDNSQVLPK